LKVAVGSTNPVKISATKNVFKQVYGLLAEIISVEVDPGVSHTPFGEDQIVKGAINRAIKAIRSTNAEFGVGMEGGIVEKFGKYFLTGWCAIVDKNGYISLASSVYLPLPKKFVDVVKQGKELGLVLEEYTGIKDIKKKEGAIGVLTSGYKDRLSAWESALIYALSIKLRPDIYR
jgi:inosine/xanthosine triphosphatase